VVPAGLIRTTKSGQGLGCGSPLVAPRAGLGGPVDEVDGDGIEASRNRQGRGGWAWMGAEVLDAGEAGSVVGQVEDRAARRPVARPSLSNPTWLMIMKIGWLHPADLLVLGS
jgi:hypothetical protein